MQGRVRVCCSWMLRRVCADGGNLSVERGCAGAASDAGTRSRRSRRRRSPTPPAGASPTPTCASAAASAPAAAPGGAPLQALLALHRDGLAPQPRDRQGQRRLARRRADDEAQRQAGLDQALERRRQLRAHDVLDPRRPLASAGSSCATASASCDARASPSAGPARRPRPGASRSPTSSTAARSPPTTAAACWRSTDISRTCRRAGAAATGSRSTAPTDPGSIGTAASAGCVRAHARDLRLLMKRVPAGTPVFIRR